MRGKLPFRNKIADRFLKRWAATSLLPVD